MKKTLLIFMLFILSSCSSSKPQNNVADVINDIDEVPDIDAQIDFTFDETRYYSTVSYNNYFFVSTEKEGILVYKANETNIGEPVASISVTADILVEKDGTLYAGGSSKISAVNIKDPENPEVISTLQTEGEVARMSPYNSELYIVTVNIENMYFLEILNIDKSGKMTKALSTELSDNIYSIHFGEKTLVTLEETEGEYSMVIREIVSGRSTVVSSYQLPNEYPGYSNFAFVPIWASVYKNIVYVFMYQLNSVSGTGPEHLSVIVDISDIKAPHFIREIATDAPLKIRKSNEIVFFIVPEFSYHLNDKVREVDVSKANTPAVTHEFNGNYASAIGSLRLTSHNTEGLRLYSVDEEVKLIDHRDSLTSAINADVSEDTVLVRNANGRLLALNIENTQPSHFDKEFNHLISTDDFYRYDSGKVYGCNKQARDSSPIVYKFSFENGLTTSERMSIYTKGVREYSDFQVSNNIVMIVPDTNERTFPIIANIAGEEVEIYDNSNLIIADKYSLKDLKVAAASENSLSLYEITAKNNVNMIAAVATDLVAKDILLVDPFIYVVDNSSIKVFERFDSALSLKKSLEIDFSSEKTVKIKKIAEYIAVSNGKTLRLLDGQLSDDYKTFTFEDDIYDFSIKDNIIVTALGELGVNFKEIEN